MKLLQEHFKIDGDFLHTDQVYIINSWFAFKNKLYQDTSVKISQKKMRVYLEQSENISTQGP